MTKKIILSISALLVLLISTFYGLKYYRSIILQGPDAPEETSFETLSFEEILPGEDLTEENSTESDGNADPDSTDQAGPVTSNSTNTSDTSVKPNSLTLNISLPFYTQAPYSNWDYPWQEACEEASVLLVANLYNEMQLNREAYNNELLRLVDWEVEYFGAYEHTTVEQTAEMLQIQYNLNSEIHENPTFQEIQNILNEGHLIIAPFAGKTLGNPNFRNGGPVYHMLVIKGYNAEKSQIVTHDVGTRNGENYVYDWSVIENALHDWHNDDILLGDKKIIEVTP